ncbi:MAG: lysophospholipid acyltransferase family protein [Deltaproteobacteria bacterium]|jgi:KDO2-lipid IV(A) lauroyltransferase|nr:lysophospholipid acyltransferase family protein [Deltaproteobacteria bacterium]
MAQTEKFQTDNIWIRLGIFSLLALTWLLTRLPRSWALTLGAWGGRLFFVLLRRRRRVTLGNLTRAQQTGALEPSLNIPQTAARTFAKLGRTASECFYLLHHGVGHFQGHWQIPGQESAWEALEIGRRENRGVIFLTAHIGNWELSSRVLPLYFNFKIYIVGRTQGPVADALLIRIRTRGGHSVIFKDGGARAMLKILRSGGVLGTLFDQSALVGGEGVPLNFMGRPALTTLAPLRLAAKTGALVVPIFSRRAGADHYFEIFPYLTPPARADQDWALSSTQALNDLLAGFIKKYPDQWMWGHRRWKSLEGIKADPRYF